MYRGERVGRSVLLVNMQHVIANGTSEGVESWWLELQKNEISSKLVVGVCYRLLMLRMRKRPIYFHSKKWQGGWRLLYSWGTSTIMILTDQPVLLTHLKLVIS